MMRRHLQLRVGKTHGFDQQALFRLPRHYCGTRISTLQDAVARIEPQSPFELLRLRAVALVAALHQQWPDLLLEEIQVVSVEFRQTFGFVRRAPRMANACQNEGEQ